MSWFSQTKTPAGRRFSPIAARLPTAPGQPGGYLTDGINLHRCLGTPYKRHRPNGRA
jgi:hypothetical protein